MSCMSSNIMLPEFGLYTRSSKRTIVLLPQPDSPINAVVVPALNSHVKFSKTLSLPFGYANETFLNVILPLIFPI